MIKFSEDEIAELTAARFTTEEIRRLERKVQSGELAFLKMIAEGRGYRFEVNEDGSELMVRPDGTVALIALPGPQLVDMADGKKTQG
jgi:hypothetical protein